MEGTAQQAIAASLNGDWETAVALNRALIEEDEEDISALNRLANALYCLGDTKTAKATADKTLRLDPDNAIAQRILEKTKQVKQGNKSPNQPQLACAGDFIAPPGRSKIVELTRVTAAAAYLLPGESVSLEPHQHSVAVLTTQKETVGRLPDNISPIVERCLNRGDRYRACVKSVAPNNKVSVFFRIDSQEKVF